MFSEERKASCEWKSSQEKVGRSPDPEQAPRARTDTKLPKTQAIMRQNESRAECICFLLPCALQGISKII